MKNLKEKVLRCLKDDEKSRNCDIRLTQMIWWKYYKEKYLFQDSEGKWSIRIASLFDLPREDHVKRIRAKIQNEQNKYLPTSEEVRRKRKINEEKWRKYLNYQQRPINLFGDRS